MNTKPTIFPLDGGPLEVRNTLSKWFAVRVRTRYEKKVAASLEYRGIEHLLPLFKANRRWSDRIAEVDLPLFPGYVFGRFQAEARLKVLTVPGVIGIVSTGKIPIPLDDKEVTSLQTAVNSGFFLQPWPFLKVGDRLTLLDGPLRNVTGILTQFKGSNTLVLSISLLQRSVAVSVDRAWVQPAA